jgi:hypothetical protein
MGSLGSANRLPCTDGLEPRYTGDYPNGDRNLPSSGSDALRVFLLDGDLNQGSRIAIKTDGTYSFGTKDVRFNSLSVIGNEARENDQVNSWFSGIADSAYLSGNTISNTLSSNDAQSMFYGAIGVKKVANGRPNSVNKMLRGYGFDEFRSGSEGGYVNWPNVYQDGGRQGELGDLFYASWVKYNYSNVHETNKTSYTGLSGTFQTGENALPLPNNANEFIAIGERTTFNSPIKGSVLGYMRYVDTVNSVAYFELDQPNSWVTGDYLNATATGNVSGAVLTLASTPVYQDQGSQKDARIMLKSDGNANIYGLVSSSLKQFFVVCNDASGVEQFRSSTSGMYSDLPVRQWYRVTMWANTRDNGSGNGVFGLIINGQTATVEFPLEFKDDLRGMVLSNWGSECSASNGLATDFGELISYTDNLSVVISESSTWAGANHLNSEPQILLDGRSNSLAEFRLNKGAHVSLAGKYLYVLSAPNTPINTSGISMPEAP